MKEFYCAFLALNQTSNRKDLGADIKNCVTSAALTKTLSRIQLDWNWPTTAYNLATIDYNADKTLPPPIEVSFRIA